MPKITIQEVETVANLARLEFDEEEKKQFTYQLERILSYIDKLNELDTENVEPTSHVLPIRNVMREDEVKPSYPREEMLKNAPQPVEGYFAVPKVIT
ncbi:TPA: Asp-tRNA(Asn)/Glu-tRNA(Gln) amidotransferase subunit GatC [Candidatus Poribacteria bacterium]|nr:Asp-tRNA(Asn)/Glu-tRNA(Gln) amidotransferase subunit GatC [Candidatus Poribacteria bacterium]HEX29614.1 Asp-tRNA(Asn)/Glu-tRNA(Gln) amidotransferase subunit GatC [Candidatus Poribacteria bacterium]